MGAYSRACGRMAAVSAEINGKLSVGLRQINTIPGDVSNLFASARLASRFSPRKRDAIGGRVEDASRAGDPGGYQATQNKVVNVTHFPSESTFNSTPHSLLPTAFEIPFIACL